MYLWDDKNLVPFRGSIYQIRNEWKWKDKSIIIIRDFSFKDVVNMAPFP